MAKITDAEFVHQWNRRVIEVIMEDGFAPPVAARIHSYVALAGYQAAYHSDPGFRTFTRVLRGFYDCPKPDPGLKYDWRVAMVAASVTAASQLVYRTFMTDSLAREHYVMLGKLVEPEVFNRSLEFGYSVGNTIISYSKGDNYHQTQGLPFWEWPKCDSCWVPTPPDFSMPMSPYCGKVRTFILEDANQFMPPPNIKFSMEPGSEFYEAAMFTYNKGKTLTDEEKLIADFWNDNPKLTLFQGHFIFASRQISPGGHWMNIAMQIMREKNTSFAEALFVYTKLSTTIFDAFTSCWEEKYRSSLIRPVTYIQKYIDPAFEPYLQTPPFPEHASGHSTITAAAAEVLSDHFGAIGFNDSTEVEFGLPVRTFKSFREAAKEANISRVYGGIHYMRGCDAGATHGKEIGIFAVQTFRSMKK